jgi:hypothetical protein
MLLWCSGVGYVVFSETYGDLTFLVKRLGRVAVALLPPLYLLTLRPCPFPNSFYLQLVPLHKWLGRIVVLLTIGHGVLYTYIYAATGKLHKLTAVSNLCGILAIVLFLAVAITSIGALRRRFYQMFYLIHYSVAWICLGLIWIHSDPPATGYIIFCIGLMVWQGVCKLMKTGHTSVLVQFVSPSLYLVTIPKTKLPNHMHSFVPGSHIRMANSMYSPLTWFQSSHPYTIASLPEEPTIKLVIRKSNYPIKLRQKYSIVGPFRSVPKQFMDAAQTGQIKRVLFVIGGSGLAFGAPLLRYLKELGVQVKLLWAIRDPQDAEVLKSIGLHDIAINDGAIEIYFTRDNRVRRRLSTASFVEAQLYKELNEDENLDIAVDDGCCMDMNRQRTRPLSDAGIRYDVEYDSEFDQDSTVDSSEEDSAVALNSVPENERQPLLPQLGISKDYEAIATPVVKKRHQYADIRDEYGHVMFNSRPVLNLRLKSWLSGLSTDSDDCCCVDQLLRASDADKQGAWVVSAGSHLLVHDTKRWADTNGFSFYQEEFNL